MLKRQQQTFVEPLVFYSTKGSIFRLRTTFHSIKTFVIHPVYFESFDRPGIPRAQAKSRFAVDVDVPGRCFDLEYGVIKLFLSSWQLGKTSSSVFALPVLRFARKIEAYLNTTSYCGLFNENTHCLILTYYTCLKNITKGMHTLTWKKRDL